MARNKILLGVTGSASAYRACDIIRGLLDGDCDVKVVMTKDAMRFIQPLSLELRSGHKIFCDIYNDEESLTPHVHYASEADCFLIAPATANTIAKIAYGMADNELTASCLVATCKKIIAPAMNTSMYENPATQANLKMLRERDFEIIEPRFGNLACGVTGTGKLASVDDIVSRTLELIR